jgi:molybdopterin-guanine dinucleotide biosynthesis protein A
MVRSPSPIMSHSPNNIMQAQSDSRPNITAVILAAGAGRRMGGEDKGMLLLNGRPLIAHVLERLAPQCEKVLLNINRNREAYAALGCPLIEDTLPGGLGPLAGLLSAMEQSDSEYVLSAPCDTPHLPTDLVARLFASLQRSGADVCTVDDGERLHPVILLVRRTLQEDLRAYLENGGRKVHDWFYRQRHCSADFSDNPAAFININTLQQLRAEENG